MPASWCQIHPPSIQYARGRISSSHIATLHSHHYRGSKKQETSVEEDTKRAERSIRHSIELVEEKIHKAVQDEVDTLFHKSPEKKQDVAEKAKKAVQQGANKVKEEVEKRSEIHHYPYEWPVHTEAHAPKDHKILHAIENAEKAVLHAVEEEVNLLFHEPEHHDNKDKETTKKAKSVLKKGVKKASENVEDTHEHRRKWLMMDENTSIEDYIKTVPAME